MYNSGESEIFLGQVLRPIRNNVIIASKCGFVFDETAQSQPVNSSKAYVKKSCEASLKRLNTEKIDVYYLHRMDPSVPIEETMEAMAELYQEGKIRSVGLSEVSADIIKRADKVFPVTAVQSEYSILVRKVAEAVLPTCKELNIAFVPFSPLGRGFLSGNITSINSLAKDDWRKSLPYLQDENITHNLKLLKKIEVIAQHKQKTSIQIALAWLLAQDPLIIPIPGASKIKHLLENVAAVDIHLSAEELAEINMLCDEVDFKGERFPPGLENFFMDVKNS